jgi:hypothetical protein
MEELMASIESMCCNSMLRCAARVTVDTIGVGSLLRRGGIARSAFRSTMDWQRFRTSPRLLCFPALGEHSLLSLRFRHVVVVFPWC